MCSQTGVERAGACSQLLSLQTWHTKHSFQGLQAAAASTNKQQNQHSPSQLPFRSLLLAGLAASALSNEAHCETSSYAAEQAQRPWWSKLLHQADPRQFFHTPEQNAFLEEMQIDPKVIHLVCYKALAW